MQSSDVEKVCKALNLDLTQLFMESYIYIEEPQDEQTLEDKCSEFLVYGKIPSAVCMYCRRIMEDRADLFYRR